MCCVKLKLFLFYGLIKKIFLSKCISIFQSSEKSIVSIVLPSPLFAEIVSPGSRGFFLSKSNWPLFLSPRYGFGTRRIWLRIATIDKAYRSAGPVRERVRFNYQFDTETKPLSLKGTRKWEERVNATK